MLGGLVAVGVGEVGMGVDVSVPRCCQGNKLFWASPMTSAVIAAMTAAIPLSIAGSVCHQCAFVWSSAISPANRRYVPVQYCD
jgi:hypothetical protein